MLHRSLHNNSIKIKKTLLNVYHYFRDKTEFRFIEVHETESIHKFSDNFEH